MAKWDNYKIGSVPWIESRRKRLTGVPFIEQAIKLRPGAKIIEIGGGELVEAQEILKQRPDINYMVIDISHTFCDNANKLGIKAERKNFCKMSLPENYCDMIYANHVLEHLENIESAIRMIIHSSRAFHLCMFKWRFKTGGILPDWCIRRGYYSTEYNIYQLLSLFGTSLKDIYTTDDMNRRTEWKHYINAHKGMDKNRNGHYLHLVGEK
jgi:hypothetical protein